MMSGTPLNKKECNHMDEKQQWVLRTIGKISCVRREAHL
jgi:hypothetical protein